MLWILYETVTGFAKGEKQLERYLINRLLVKNFKVRH